MQQSTPIKHLNIVYLYNMLQDFRHLLIFDLREHYSKIYIRDSFNVTKDTSKDQIRDVIAIAEQKATDKEMKYKQIKSVRRFFFVNDTKVTDQQHIPQQILSILNQKSSKDDKIYALDSSFTVFTQKYPFMCLWSQKLEQIKKSGNQQQMDRALLYPYSKFPSQIIPDKLYISNIYSSNSQKQLVDLSIINLIDFIDYKQSQVIPVFKSNKYHLIQLPFNKDVPAALDFDLINLEIDKKVQQGKTLLYCKDGEVISPAFAISYLMFKTKIDINLATLKVCQAISRVEICKWIYTQLLTYKPKK